MIHSLTGGLRVCMRGACNLTASVCLSARQSLCICTWRNDVPGLFYVDAARVSPPGNLSLTVQTVTFPCVHVSVSMAVNKSESGH